MLFCTVGIISFTTCSLHAQDPIENFYENRFSLSPRTEEEEMAALDVVKTFFEKINSHQASEAYFINASTQFQAATSLEDFKLFVEPLVGLDFKQKLDKHNITFTTNDKSKATFFCILNGKIKGQNLKIDFQLENQDGDWKIMGIKIYEINKSME